jgi:post-segregation antitoxin (ccd killing protein)
MGKVELNIDAALLAKAEAAGLSAERIAEAAIRNAVDRANQQEQSSRAAQWAEENAEAIAAHQAQIEKFGVFGQDLRTW